MLFLTCALEPTLASQHWISVTTPHFEMYTTNSEKQAERALQTFEQVRYFFQRNSRNNKAPEGRVRIIAFSSEGEFKPYRMNGGNFAFYLQSRERDYIVMQDIQPDHIQAAAHEYTHLIIRHNKLELPLWLDEGLAELYSSLEPRGQQALIGRPPVQHVMTLQNRQWIETNTLFAVDHESPYYNQSDKMQTFYAESWAMTHMLALSPAYIRRFPDFLLAVNGGASSAEALQKVYGKSVQEVTKDLQDYVRRTSVPAAVYQVELKKSDLDTEVAALSDFRIGLALADLLASRPQTAEEAHRRLVTLEGENLQDPDVEESLGYLAWQQNNIPEARKRFSLAVERGSKNGRMFYDYANLEHTAGGPEQSVLNLMKKAVELRPEDNSSRILLAQLQLAQNLYGQALGTIAPIHTIEPGQAFDFYTVSAYCHANLKDFAGARVSAEKARPFAKTPAQLQQMEHFTEYLDAAGRQPAGGDEAAPQDVAAAAPAGSPALEPQQQIVTQVKENAGLPRVHGTTKTFQCAQHAFRLHIQVDQREMVFAIDDPKNIVVRNVTNLQWSCGPLKPQEITVIYKPTESSKFDGTVTELVFPSPGK